jgi:hypothetical protein
MVVVSFRMMDLPSWGPSHGFMVAGRLDHKVPKPHVSFRCSKRAGARKSQKQFSGTSQPTAGTRTSGVPRITARPPVHSRRALPRRVQIALKPASKRLGLHGVFIRSKGLKDLIADSAFKRMQVDVQGACRLDADEHHLGLAPRTGRASDCSESNDGRQGLRLGHDASLNTGGSTTLSVTGNALGGGAVIIQVCASWGLKRESNSLAPGVKLRRNQVALANPVRRLGCPNPHQRPS